MSHSDHYDKLPVRNYYPSSSLVSPDKPFTNKAIMWDAIRSCEDYICWVDKWFELLVQSFDKNKVKQIKILTSAHKVNEELKNLFKDFRDEM
jgi:hypothetical protein